MVCLNKTYGLWAEFYSLTCKFEKLKKERADFLHTKQQKKSHVEGGGVYTEFQPDIRALDAIMGIVPIVGRLVIVTNKETQEKRTYYRFTSQHKQQEQKTN